MGLEEVGWQNLSVGQQQGRKCQDLIFGRVTPGTETQRLTVGASDLAPLDLCLGWYQQESEGAQVQLTWFYHQALWNRCASESRDHGKIVTLFDSFHT